MEPVSELLWMSRCLINERLPSIGEMVPERDNPVRDKVTTLCRRALHETPTHLQKEVLVSQLESRVPVGS